MAKSLLCKDCNSLFRNIKEAQVHGDATGHSNFEESTTPVPQLVCTDCGKVCRSDAEKTLHTKFTGHANYVDKTGEDLEVLNTEQQIADAKAEMEEDLEADAALLGLKTKKAKAKPAAEGASGSGEAAAATAEGAADGGDVEMTEAAEEELVPVEVDEVLLKDLEEMGFTTNRAKRALHGSGNSSIEGAINWITQHENDADIDEPLLVRKDKQPPEKHLTPEEAKAKAEELVRKAREKREKEEREMEALREKERIRMGKEILEAQKKEEDLRLKRMAEERQREKDEDARARQALRKKLEEDRRERRRKLGLPEELTEEEKAREAEKEKAKAEAELRRHVYIKPISVIEKMRDVLVSMKKSAPAGDEQFKTAVNTLMKYIGNIARAPEEGKFRSIKTSNAAFQQRVAAVPGSMDFLQLCGFEEKDGVLVMAAEQVNMEVLNAAGGELNNALTNPFFGAL